MPPAYHGSAHLVDGLDWRDYDVRKTEQELQAAVLRSWLASTELIATTRVEYARFNTKKGHEAATSEKLAVHCRQTQPKRGAPGRRCHIQFTAAHDLDHDFQN